MICPEYRSAAEFVRVEDAEFPESELILLRRVLTGIRDCEPRLPIPADLVGGLGDSRCCGGNGCGVLAGNGDLIGIPVKSLLVRRCIPGGRLGTVFSILISSNVGMTPRYHAEGDDGETSPASRCGSSGNIGFGLLMLPSDPLRLRGTGIP